jgi:hypothetical protein
MRESVVPLVGIRAILGTPMVRSSRTMTGLRVPFQKIETRHRSGARQTVQDMTAQRVVFREGGMIEFK